MKKSVLLRPQGASNAFWYHSTRLHVLLVDEVDVVALERRRVGLPVGDDLELDVVRTQQVGDATAGAALTLRGRRGTRDRLSTHGRAIQPVRLELFDESRHARRGEADMVERGAPVGARRLLHVQEDQDIGQLDHVDVVAPELHGGSPQRADPELLLFLDARHVEVIVADSNGRLLVAQELPGTYPIARLKRTTPGRLRCTFVSWKPLSLHGIRTRCDRVWIDGENGTISAIAVQDGTAIYITSSGSRWSLLRPIPRAELRL